MFGLRKTTPVEAPPLTPLRQKLLALGTEVAQAATAQLGLPVGTGALARPLSSFLTGRTDAELIEMLALADHVLDELWRTVPAEERAQAQQKIAAG